MHENNKTIPARSNFKEMTKSSAGNQFMYNQMKQQ